MANSCVIFSRCNLSAVAAKKTDWRPKYSCYRFWTNPPECECRLRNTCVNDKPEHLCSSSPCREIGGWSVLRRALFLRCTVWHKNLGPVVRTVQLQILCISTHLMWGGGMGGVQRPWSAGLMPQEQSGFSVLLKVSATADMYAHWQSNHWAPLLPEWLDSIKQQSHLNNKSVKP